MRYRGDHVGVHPQKQPGLSYLGCSVTVGRLAGTDLVEAARLADVYGDGEIRLATDQNLVLTGIPDERVEELLEEDFVQRHSPFRLRSSVESSPAQGASSAASRWWRQRSGPCNGRGRWTGRYATRIAALEGTGQAPTRS